MLLVANVLLYGLQMLSGQLITAWGIKVRALGMKAVGRGGAVRHGRSLRCTLMLSGAVPGNAMLMCSRSVAWLLPASNPGAAAPPRPPPPRPQHNALIAAGQWWRLLTPAFLHADVIHLAVNSASLNNLGPLVEATAGCVASAFHVYSLSMVNH